MYSSQSSTLSGLIFSGTSCLLQYCSTFGRSWKSISFLSFGTCGKVICKSCRTIVSPCVEWGHIFTPSVSSLYQSLKNFLISYLESFENFSGYPNLNSLSARSKLPSSLLFLKSTKDLFKSITAFTMNPLAAIAWLCLSASNSA